MNFITELEPTNIHHYTIWTSSQFYQYNIVNMCTLVFSLWHLHIPFNFGLFRHNSFIHFVVHMQYNRTAKTEVMQAITQLFNIFYNFDEKLSYFKVK